MPLKKAFVVARSYTGHATLMHLLIDGQTEWTSCGRNTSYWSRAYVRNSIPEIMCKKCSRLVG